MGNLMISYICHMYVKKTPLSLILIPYDCTGRSTRFPYIYYWRSRSLAEDLTDIAGTLTTSSTHYWSRNNVGANRLSDYWNELE